MNLAEIQKNYLERQSYISAQLQKNHWNEEHTDVTQLTEFETSENRRLTQETEGFGPLEELLNDESISEIFVNGPRSIYFEKNGMIEIHNDYFFSEMSFKTIIERLLTDSQRQLTLEQPSLDVTFKNFRFSLVGEPLTQGSTHFCLRRHPKNPWTFSKLIEQQWCTDEEHKLIIQILNSKSSILIIGPTGSGKTSVINALLHQVPANERCLLIEDNSEICVPNPVSLKLLTREDPYGILPAITQNDLIKKSLRLRPDRLIMGEIRGIEAKDYLLALSTGHSGSLATLHAQDPHEALLRLEMLIQMGAPQWSLSSIRRLIYLSLHHILVVDKNLNGKRFLKGIYKINSLEDLGFLLEKLDPENAH